MIVKIQHEETHQYHPTWHNSTIVKWFLLKLLDFSDQISPYQVRLFRTTIDFNVTPVDFYFPGIRPHGFRPKLRSYVFKAWRFICRGGKVKEYSRQTPPCLTSNHWQHGMAQWRWVWGSSRLSSYLSANHWVVKSTELVCINIESHFLDVQHTESPKHSFFFLFLSYQPKTLTKKTDSSFPSFSSSF